MLKHFCMTALMAALFLLTACDAHRYNEDPVNLAVGQVLCTDGKVYTVAQCDSLNKKPIAVVFHVDSRDELPGYGYAVYIDDIRAEQFADSIGVAQGTSKDIKAYDGNKNTFAMYTGNVKSPIAITLFDVWYYGQSAYLPSVAEMKLLYNNKDLVNPVLKRYNGTVLPSDSEDCWYWTSTEVEGQETAKAWLFSMNAGTIHETPKYHSHRGRPIITLN